MRERQPVEPPNGSIRAVPVGGILAVLMIAMSLSPAALGQGPAAPPATQSGGSFQGEWSATGHRQALPSGSGRTATIAYFSGSLLLGAEGGLSRGFRYEAVTYDDGKGDSVGSCVWTDEHGDQIYSDLKGQAIESGKHIAGTITGGTGRYAGITGEYAFDWQYVIVTAEGDVQGRVTSLKGSWRRGPGLSGGAP
jgi:hypothetical protein